MTKTDPLRKRLIEAEASWLIYGTGATAVELVESFGSVEIEYAALRKGCVLVDLPHRATLRLTGGDRRSLMNSLFTQELKDLDAGMSRRTLWLNRQGRIDADLRIVELDDETFLDLDCNAAERACTSIDQYIITEDAAIEDASERWHRMALHGPEAGALLAGVADVMNLEPGQSRECEIAGVRVIIDRQDSLGVPGYELLIDALRVGEVDDAIAQAGEPDESMRFKRAGWLACNTARIESGWPLYLTDFGPDSIPNELGALLEDRVSFTKGCYLGQEVVARIHAQGKPKRLLVAIRFERETVGVGVSESMGEDETTRTLQPATAGTLLDAPDGKIIGAITSSTLSPMLGDVPIALAQVKTSVATPGTKVYADLSTRTLACIVQGTLSFL